MFPPKVYGKIALSTATVLLMLGTLVYLMTQFGVLPVVLWYFCPYFVVNAWLVLYTWMHHTDPSVPHYGDGEWSWVRGALGTIDRDYGIFDFFHHTIGSTHVVHHLFHELPWYHADEATVAVKAFLEPKGLYNFDPTPWYRVPWRIATRCHYVEESAGIQFYKSLEDVSLTHNATTKAKKL
jgi:omega-6 fatty acid desaturase (delta-12 desaturase)